MKVRWLAVALIGVATYSGASCALAGTPSALSDDDSTAVFGSGALLNLQETGGSARIGESTASLDANALRGASGNLGVNLSAGALNVQTNQIALITTPRAEITSQQTVHAAAQVSGSANASIGAGAMANVSGNVGVNIAAGASNAQFNGLVVH